jgi:hypothetical protein
MSKKQRPEINLETDIRSFVLSGNVEPIRQAIFVQRIGGWYNVQELMADERATVLQAAINQETGKLIFPVLYPALVVYCLRYPRPDTLPPEPVLPEKPEPIGEDASEQDRLAYEAAVVQYKAALAQYKIDVARYATYPGLGNNPPHPRGGDRVFDPKDREAVARQLPGNVIEEIAMPAFMLAGLDQAEVEEEKKDLKSTPTSTTATV